MINENVFFIFSDCTNQLLCSKSNILNVKQVKEKVVINGIVYMVMSLCHVSLCYNTMLPSFY